MVKRKRISKKDKRISVLKKNWQKWVFSLIGMIACLLLTKACDAIWPDTPVVVKEYADTVKVVHSMAPLQVDTDSIFRKQIEQQLMNVELLNKYEEQITGKREAAKANVCKIVVENPYPNSHGYSIQSASSYCFIKQITHGPFLDITYDFFREDYIDLINTLCVKISRKNNEDGRILVVSDLNYEPQTGKNESLVRMVNDFPPGEYTIEAGFILKENRLDKYPAFYRHTFTLRK